jgi:thymidylate synthase
MVPIVVDTANQAWISALNLLKDNGNAQGGRIEATTELLHVAFEVKNPRQRIVMAREIDPAFAIAEVIWILAGANDVEFLKKWNKRMARFVDGENPYFHGAYGYRLGFKPSLEPDQLKRLRHDSMFNITKKDQVKLAIAALRESENSRQVVLQYWHGDYDLPSPKPRSEDVPCNVASHLMIRDGKLEWLQVMRSNDLIWGTPYNFIQFMTIHEIFSGWLGVEVGSYNHISDSLHIYEKHRKDYLETDSPIDADVKNLADLRLPYQEWEETWRVLVGVALALTDAESENEVLAVLPRAQGLKEGYQEWVFLLCAESLRKRKFDKRALEVIKSAGEYWSTSWMKWYQLKQKDEETKGSS